MKKFLSVLLILLLSVGVLAACGGREPEPLAFEDTPPGEAAETGSENPDFTRLTQWDYHPGYSFHLMGVEEYGDSLLLRGFIARDVLTPEEAGAARAESAIEINGDIFIHTHVDIEGFMSNDRLYNERTGLEIFLIPAFFGEFEGDDVRYRMYKNDGQTPFFKQTEMYREVEVEKTTPVEIWRPVVEPMEWGYLELFAPMEASARAFYDFTRYDLPGGFPFRGVLAFVFENGKCVHIRYNTLPDA